MTDGGPAFPCTKYWDCRVEEYQPPETDGGMSLRDWFAGMALAGWLASYGPHAPHPTVDSMEDCVAQDAYAMADAMLKERSCDPQATS